MNPETTQHSVQWRDLCAPNQWHTTLEVARPLLLCAAAVWAMANAHIVPGLLLLLFGHIAALRTAHGAVHKTLGLPRSANPIALHTVSAMLATSCHALEFTHKLHHRRSCAPADVEGRIAHLNFWQACLASPTYHWQVIKAAWRLGNSNRKKVIARDLSLAIALHASLAIALGTAVFWLWLGLIALNGSSGLLSVWLFHRGGEITRSSHWAIANWLTMGMLYHGEHHRYPGVPTARLSELARRLKVARAQPAPLIDWACFTAKEKHREPYQPPKPF